MKNLLKNIYKPSGKLAVVIFLFSYFLMFVNLFKDFSHTTPKTQIFIPTNDFLWFSIPYAILIFIWLWGEIYFAPKIKNPPFSAFTTSLIIGLPFMLGIIFLSQNLFAFNPGTALKGYTHTDTYIGTIDEIEYNLYQERNCQIKFNTNKKLYFSPDSIRIFIDDKQCSKVKIGQKIKVFGDNVAHIGFFPYLGHIWYEPVKIEIIK